MGWKKNVTWTGGREPSLKTWKRPSLTPRRQMDKSVHRLLLYLVERGRRVIKLGDQQTRAWRSDAGNAEPCTSRYGIKCLLREASGFNAMKKNDVQVVYTMRKMSLQYKKHAQTPPLVSSRTGI
ncbi:uncharacterized protein [Canis lupus baileyi]|uniref:uncharacterized protein isoform X2 n=1 Tax=Canis lupus baileyi TaxID=143281 RepID=UPI003B96EC29